MSEQNRVETPEVVRLVEEFVSSEHRDARRYENKVVLDDGGAFTLHRLAARVYALGYAAGEAAESERWRGLHQRERDAASESGS